MAQLMPLPLTGTCFSKIQIGFTFLVAELCLVVFQAFRTKGDSRYIMFGAGNNNQFKQVCQASVDLPFYPPCSVVAR